jgi:hypothetical protein
MAVIGYRTRLAPHTQGRGHAKAPRPIELLPDNTLHHSGEKVIIKANGLQNRYLIMFNITGDGKVQ